MTVFFVEWELWQEMTFVLACCIVAVFVIGTIRLWWTTRAMRKLEVIDEEKRARISDIRHCGIDDWQADSIPFGVRALYTGVEVDGIWESRPHAPKWSQVASSATLMGNDMDDAKGKSKCSESNESSDVRNRHTSDNSTIDQLLYDPAVQDHSGFNASPLAVLVPTTSARQTSERLRESSDGDLRLYLPTGWQSPDSSRGVPSNGGTSPAPSASPARLTSSTIPPSSITPRIISPLHGQVQVTVHVNKTKRRPNENFEILPAGELGPRSDVQELNPLRSLEEIRLPHFQPGPAKLRKKNAPRSGND